MAEESALVRSQFSNGPAGWLHEHTRRVCCLRNRRGTVAVHTRRVDPGPGICRPVRTHCETALVFPHQLLVYPASGETASAETINFPLDSLDLRIK